LAKYANPTGDFHNKIGQEETHALQHERKQEDRPRSDLSEIR
jgi:hypothetical protein